MQDGPGQGHVNGACLSIEAIDRIAARGETATAEAVHLSTCEGCRLAVEAARVDEALARELAAAIGRKEHGRGAEATSATLAAGARLGRFTIVGELGTGGMGTVYRAMQDSPRREVALKVLRGTRATASQRRRFEHESAALALVQHPGIAQVYEAGVAEVEVAGGEGVGGERAYIAMELVEGRTLDEYAREAGLHVRARVEIMASVADAVDHAHRRGVIHRDLKPSNVLVTREGRAKVLDFGVAKFSGESGVEGAELTMAGSFVGTLAYASPEQVSGDPGSVDLRTDVFSLGVMVYEIVVGRRPFELGESLGEAVSAIKEARIAEPWKFGVKVDGELMTVLKTALAADPGRRYQSAAALAEDLRRYLEKRVLRARPDSAAYTLQRAIARHPVRAAVIAAGVVGVAGTGAMMLGLQYKAAREERAKSGVLDAMVGALERTNQDEVNTPRITTLEEFLADAGQAIDAQLAEFPSERVLLKERLGRANLSHQRLDDAEKMLNEAAEYRKREAEREPQAYASVLMDLGKLLLRQGRFEEAQARFEEAREIRSRVLGAEHRETIKATHWIGATLLGWRKYEQAEAELARAVEQQERLDSGTPSNESAEYLNGLAACVRARGDFERALGIARRALESIERSAGVESKPVAVAISNVATNLISLERYEQAEPLLNRALELRKKWYGPKDPRLADTLVLLTGLKMRMGGWGEDEVRRGRLEEAEASGREALDLRRRVRSGDHESVAEAMSLLGQVQMRRGVKEEACTLLRSAMEMRARLPRNSDGDLGRSESMYGECLMRAGQLDDAEQYLRSGLEKVRTTYGAEHKHARDAQARVEALNKRRAGE